MVPVKSSYSYNVKLFVILGYTDITLEEYELLTGITYTKFLSYGQHKFFTDSDKL